MGMMRFDGIAATLSWLLRRGVTGLQVDSRRLRPGEVFIAWPGHAQDGRQHVKAALAAGAPACLVEAEGVEAFGFDDEPRIAAVGGLKAATGELAAAFYGHPSDALSVVAVTGTNGKTSSTWWIAQALTALGQRCGVVGTLGIGSPPDLVSTGLTTPDAVSLQAAFRRFADEGYRACAIEASSIAIEEQRLAGVRVATAVFTNFTQDHLDYHGSMAAYWQAKARLFAWSGLRHAVINLDDPQGAVLVGQLAHSPVAVWTVGRHASARLRAEAVAYVDGGLSFTVHEAGQSVPVHTRLIGDYNVANLLGVIGSLRAAGIPLAAAAEACGGLTPVPGRMQLVEPMDASADAPRVVVDYAHTPDALDKALQALQPLAAARGGALWCVFGCGGNRDAAKRPLMGGIAERLAQRVVLTSDNPRHESPAAILADIRAGLQRPEAAWSIEDRDTAITQAIAQAAPADVVLVAGKGHEDYQEVAGERRPFSDVAQAREALAARAGIAAAGGLAA
jgi:UDP-N-acetylmuramyl-tripeptide synthetase